MMNLPLSTGINRDWKRVPRTTLGDRDHRQDVKEKTHRIDFFRLETSEFNTLSLF